MRTNELGQPIGDPVDGWVARAVPGGVVLTGRYCRLEPLAATHAGDLYRALHQDTSNRQWTYMAVGPFDGADDFADYVRGILADDAVRWYAVVDARTGLAAGIASYSRVSPAHGTVEVASVIYGAALQRTPATTEAMYLMAAHVFDDLGYRRYEWKCDALNAASMAAARRLGFAYEGTWRQAVVYKGRNRDTAWFAMTDGDWRALRPVLQAWLDPTNFDDGRQLTSLSERTARARAALDG